MMYEYGGKHFKPHSKLGKVKEIAELLLEADPELGFFDADYNGRKMKFQYNHDAFYKAMNDSEMDVFLCVENGKLYVPCEHELFIYKGKRTTPKDV